jgi:hypothetical protein
MRELLSTFFEGRAGGAQLPRPPLKLPSQPPFMGPAKGGVFEPALSRLP